MIRIHDLTEFYAGTIRCFVYVHLSDPLSFHFWRVQRPWGPCVRVLKLGPLAFGWETP